MKASIHRHTSPGDVSTMTSFEFGENWFTCPLVIGAWMHQCVHLPTPYKVLIKFPFPSLQFFFSPVTINEISKISGERTKSSCANKIAFLDVRGLLYFNFLLFFLCIC